MRLRSVLALIAASVLATACASEVEPGVGHVSLATASTFASLDVNAVCQLTTGCCAAAGYGSDMATCRTLIASVKGLSNELDGVSAGVVTGPNVTYNDAAATQCLTGIQGLGCSNMAAAGYKSTLQSCFAVYQGKLAAGAACTASIECAPGNFCDAGSRRCAALRAVGAACTASDQCSYRGAGATCADGQCVPPLPDGSLCSAGLECASGLCDGTCVRTAATPFGAATCAELSGGAPVVDAGPPPSRNCAINKDANGFFKLTTPSGLDYWVRVPASYSTANPQPTRAVIGTHGCGDNAYNFATWAMAPWDVRATQDYIAISVGAGRDGQCWDTAADEAKVLAVLDDARSCLYLHQKQTTMAGYSSGGGLAYRTALHNAGRFAGVLIENSSLSTFGAGTDAALAAAAWKLNVAISARTEDGDYPIATVRADRAKLVAAGFPVQYRELAGGHSGTGDDWSLYLLPKMRPWNAP